MVFNGVMYCIVHTKFVRAGRFEKEEKIIKKYILQHLGSLENKEKKTQTYRTI